jgi:hypothetical protein
VRYLTWNQMGSARRVWEAVGGALVFGTLCGLALGASLPLYLAGGVIACLAGVVGGSQHADLRGALLRGVAGGTTFGLSVLLGFELGGAADPVAALPDPRILFLLTTVVPSFPLHALGYRIARRRARSAATAAAALAD